MYQPNLSTSRSFCLLKLTLMFTPTIYFGHAGLLNKQKMVYFFMLFLGNALLRRLVRIGVLDESKMKLDYVLGLKVEDFLERRLQTQVFKLGLAKSIHHARVLIRQRHIR